MKILTTSLPDIKIIVPSVFEDSRGFFLESYQQHKFSEITRITANFVQDNLSHSHQNVIRGLHYQIQHPQGKLVSVINGKAFDVAVDMRKSSATFGQWVGVYLDSLAHHMMWIPPGFAHGYLAFSETVDFFYKVTDYYDPDSEHCLCWNDPDVGIDWPLNLSPMISEKDKQGKTLKQAVAFP